MRQQALVGGSRFKLKFPHGLAASGPFKVDLLVPLQSPTLGLSCDPKHWFSGNSSNQDSSTELKLESKGGSIQVKLQVTKDNSPPRHAKRAVSQLNGAAVDARAYLDDHHLLEFLQDAMSDLLRDRPINPWEYIVRMARTREKVSTNTTGSENLQAARSDPRATGKERPVERSKTGNERSADHSMGTGSHAGDSLQNPDTRDNAPRSHSPSSLRGNNDQPSNRQEQARAMLSGLADVVPTLVQEESVSGVGPQSKPMAKLAAETSAEPERSQVQLPLEPGTSAAVPGQAAETFTEHDRLSSGRAMLAGLANAVPTLVQQEAASEVNAPSMPMSSLSADTPAQFQRSPVQLPSAFSVSVPYLPLDSSAPGRLPANAAVAPKMPAAQTVDPSAMKLAMARQAMKTLVDHGGSGRNSSALPEGESSSRGHGHHAVNEQVDNRAGGQMKRGDCADSRSSSAAASADHLTSAGRFREVCVCGNVFPEDAVFLQQVWKEASRGGQVCKQPVEKKGRRALQKQPCYCAREPSHHRNIG